MGDPKPRQRFRPGNDIAEEPFFGGAAKGETQIHTPMTEEAVSFLSDSREAPTVPASTEVISLFDDQDRAHNAQRHLERQQREAATEMIESAASGRMQEAPTTVVQLDDHRTPKDLQSLRAVKRQSTTISDDKPITVDAMLPKKPEQRPIGTRIQEYLETKIKPGYPEFAQVRVEAAINTLRTLEEAYRDMSEQKRTHVAYVGPNEVGERQFKWQILLNEVQQNSLFVPDGVKIKVKETDLENMAINDEIALIQSLRLRLQSEANEAKATRTRPMVDETIVHKNAANA